MVELAVKVEYLLLPQEVATQYQLVDQDQHSNQSTHPRMRSHSCMLTQPNHTRLQEIYSTL